MPIGNIQLTPQLIQAVRDAADIESIASEHTRLKKVGRRYQGLCPIHKEKTPSFSIDPVQGLFYCFGCGAGGDAIKLHMLTSGDDFPAAIEALAARYRIPLPARGARPGSRPERDLEGALTAAAAFFADQLRSSPLAQGYLEKRRVASELVERFALGYAPDDWRGLLSALHPRVPASDLEAAGLVARPERGGEPYDRFRNRLMFPIHNPSGRLVGFGGRTLGDDQAKYINTSETERFHKGNLLYGLYQAKREIRDSRRAVLVEGYFDVISAVASGREGAVAGMGTALTAEQASLLSRYADEVVVAYDGDNAGETAFRRALPLLLAADLGVRRALFPAGHDPDSLRLEAGGAAVAAALDAAEDGVVIELRRAIPGPTASPKLKAETATAIAGLLAPLRDPLMRSEYVRRAAEMLGVSEKEFISRFKELKGWQGVAPQPRSASGQVRADQPPGGSASGTGAFGAPGAPGPHLVRSLEEQVLANLLQAAERAEGAEAAPSLAELPSPEVFLDLECRNIYQAFCTLYARGGGSPPEVRAVLAEMGSQQGVVDRMAAILLEGSFGPAKAGLLESLDKLLRRWRQQRLRELKSEMAEAQRRGDRARLASLVEEKTSLSQSLHRGARL
ncbi:MAG TPA: DNA primase [Thermoanaerobaculia bacterium]|nr:DNA primase [Thermoanaerobaculia bacterium]